MNYRNKQFQRFLTRIRTHIFVLANTRTIKGAKYVSWTTSDCSVVSLVKDAEEYIEEFIDYYLKLGIKHIILLDNGSNDKTIQIASKYQSVTILECLLPFGKYKVEMRQFLLDQYSLGRWCILVDCDEFFDFPYSEKKLLRDFCDWLDSHNYNAVIAHMLDMFPAKAIDSSTVDESFRKTHRYFETESISSKNIPAGLSNKLPNSEIKIRYGGVRDRVFGNSPTLSKFSMIKPNFRLLLVGSHLINWARIADTECVLYHYKFLPGFSRKVDAAVLGEQYFNASSEYRLYQSILNKYKSLSLHSEKSQEVTNTDNLIRLGLMKINDDYYDKSQDDTMGEVS